VFAVQRVVAFVERKNERTALARVKRTVGMPGSQNILENGDVDWHAKGSRRGSVPLVCFLSIVLPAATSPPELRAVSFFARWYQGRERAFHVSYIRVKSVDTVRLTRGLLFYITNKRDRS